MNIIWKGQSFFEIFTRNKQSEEVKIIIDPFGDGIGLHVPKNIEADIVLVSHNHSDHNNVKAISSKAGKPFVIDSAGEYEVKGIFVRGIAGFHDNEQGKDRGAIVMYKIEAENMKICHLSDLGQKELSVEQLEDIGAVDILMVPVASKHSLDAKGAADVIAQIEPRVIIPMHYKIPKLTVDLDGVDKFLKMMGQEKTAPEKKLKISLRDLPQEETKIIVLES